MSNKVWIPFDPLYQIKIGNEKTSKTVGRVGWVRRVCWNTSAISSSHDLCFVFAKKFGAEWQKLESSNIDSFGAGVQPYELNKLQDLYLFLSQSSTVAAHPSSGKSRSNTMIPMDTSEHPSTRGSMEYQSPQEQSSAEPRKRLLRVMFGHELPSVSQAPAVLLWLDQIHVLQALQ
jgi:hypothetical protein